jgi:ornithine cyclodeaminase
LLILNGEEVRRFLPMGECIEVMDTAMRAVSTGAVGAPSRTVLPLEEDAGHFFLMPGSMLEPPVYGAKAVGLHPGNPERGRPAVQGLVILFDRRSGAPMALMDGAAITAVRTAAASALAARELARDDAVSHGILGTGVLAAAHLEAVSCVRRIREVCVWGRDHAKAQAFAEQHAESTGAKVSAVPEAAEAAGCDVVSVVTNSPMPVLRGAWLEPGAHVSLVGAHRAGHREADTAAVAGAAVYVDSRAGALLEAGDLLIPMAEGALGEEHIIGEIGEVLEGTAPGRSNGRQITLYKSLGLVSQDLYAAEHAFRAADAAGAGSRVAL